MSEEKEEAPKLEWMYKNDANNVDSEEYLLGRKIDRAFETQNKVNDVDKDIIPASIFSNSNITFQVDAIRKAKEDPLEQIKEKEFEMRRQILKNPVKLKKLQTLLEAKEKVARKELKKKQKKEKEDNIDDLITEKYAKLMKKYGVKTIEELVDKMEDDDESDRKKKKKKKRKSDSESSEEETKKSKKKRRNSSPQNSEDERRKRKYRKESSDWSERKHKSKNYERKYSPESKRDKKYKRGRSSSPDRHYRDKSFSHKKDNERNRLEKSPEVRRKRYDSDDDKPKERAYGLILPSGKSVAKKPDVRHTTEKKPEVKAPVKSHRPVKLSEKEKEARLKEMMINAKWRDEARQKNIKKYREQEKLESKKNDKEYDTDFARRQFSLATSDSTVEQRIKSKINTIQRSVHAMDRK